MYNCALISNNVKYRLRICYSGHNQEWRWPWLLASGHAWISWTADSSLGILSLIFKYSFTDNCQYLVSGLVEDTASPPPDWARSWSQANTGHTSGLQTGISQSRWGFEDLSKWDKVLTPLCFELNDAIPFSPAGCCHWSEAVQAGSLVQCVLAVMLRPGDDRMFVFTNKYTTGDQEPAENRNRKYSNCSLSLNCTTHVCVCFLAATLQQWNCVQTYLKVCFKAYFHNEWSLLSFNNHENLQKSDTHILRTEI